MDSLFATYASSDEEEEEEAQQQQNTASKSSSLFSALPQPKSSSLFSSLRNPKEEEEEQINPTKPSSFFSSLPPPKTQPQQQPISIPKRVVQFKPPVNPSSFKPTNSDDDDQDEEELERKKPRETESLTVTSFLSTIPAPKNSSTLGLVPSSSGSGRRSILETEPPVSTSNAVVAENESGNNQNVADYVHYDQNTGAYVNYATYDQNVSSGDAALSYGSYENYGSYGDYGNNWGDGSASMVPHTTAAAVVSDSVVRVPGKRRRNEIPMDIVEVKQDELMKDRPREDQVKLTGIAFGPSYQPVSTKGKPSKIHKRKHQIGTLYYDMKQREMELSDRRAKGFLTKAETQAKYGW